MKKYQKPVISVQNISSRESLMVVGSFGGSEDVTPMSNKQNIDVTLGHWE